jgi:hypothetical protein
MVKKLAVAVAFAAATFGGVGTAHADAFCGRGAYFDPVYEQCVPYAYDSGMGRHGRHGQTNAAPQGGGAGKHGHGGHSHS